MRISCLRLDLFPARKAILETLCLRSCMLFHMIGNKTIYCSLVPCYYGLSLLRTLNLPAPLGLVLKTVRPSQRSQCVTCHCTGEAASNCNLPRKLNKFKNLKDHVSGDQKAIFWSNNTDNQVLTKDVMIQVGQGSKANLRNLCKTKICIIT